MALNLLPKTSQEQEEEDLILRDSDYWNAFFQNLARKLPNPPLFQWNGDSLPELYGHLHKYIKATDDILMVGCGNSKHGQHLYDVGCHHITIIDSSPFVIQQMNDVNTTRPQMHYIHMDARQMRFTDGQFSVVLDSGRLGALCTDYTAASRYLSEITRVLRKGGRYVRLSTSGCL